MENENKDRITPTPDAPSERSLPRRDAAANGDNTSAAQRSIPKILNTGARQPESSGARQATTNAARQGVPNGTRQTATNAARQNMPNATCQASSNAAQRTAQSGGRQSPNGVRQAEHGAARQNARSDSGAASRRSAQTVAARSDKANESGVRPVDVSTLRRKRSGFFRGLRIYIIIALAVIAVGLGVFYAFMSAFEYTRAENRIKDYFSSLDGSAVYPLISERRGADKENAAALATDLSAAADMLSCARTGGTGDDGSLTYGVTNGGKTIALVTIAPSGEVRFGLDVYSVTSCRLADSYASEFLPTYYSAVIYAPSSGTVTLCGEELDRAQAEQGNVYPILDGLSAYEGGDDRELIYRVDDLTEQPSAQYRDSAGAVFEGSFDSDGVCRFDGVGSAPLAVNCTQTVENFIKTYVTYTAAGYTDGSMAKFEATRALTARGSEAYDDITASRFSFAQNIPCTVKSLDITSYDYFAHGEGMFSCKVDFTAEMKNFGQKTDTVKGAELVFARQGDAEYLLVRMRLGG